MRAFSRWILPLWFACSMIHAQDTQFLPEVDAHLTLNSHLKPYLQALDDRQGGDPEQFTFGPSLEFYLKPLVKLQRVTIFDLDDEKSRPFVLETGYRVITAPDTPPENRAIEAATFRIPPGAGFILSDRNRADLDWQNGKFTWRYRNKLKLERTFSARSYHLIPYLAAEPFYISQYNKWSSTNLYVGCQFPVGQHVEFDTYYEHENNTGKSPNRQNNFFGLALYLFFSVEGNSKSSTQSTKANAHLR